VLEVERAAELLGEEEALLDQDPISLAPGRPAHVVGSRGMHHVGEKDDRRLAAHQALRGVEPLGGIVTGRPVEQRHLKLVLEGAQPDPAPDEEAIALAFRAAQKFQIEHRRPPSAAYN
jgi:hypothetical protein